MAENKIEEVAKLLGVELEEEFKVYGCDGFCKITELGLERYVKERSWFMDSMMLTDLIKGTAKIIKLPKPILDDVEKEYLSNITKPLKKIKYISKNKKFSGDYEYISIVYRDSTGECALIFPDFKAGRMYRGMLTGKRYTIQELGL